VGPGYNIPFVGNPMNEKLYVFSEVSHMTFLETIVRRLTESVPTVMKPFTYFSVLLPYNRKKKLCSKLSLK
jgi:hypothetical protein